MTYNLDTIEREAEYQISRGGVNLGMLRPSLGAENILAMCADIKRMREALETIADDNNWGADGCWTGKSYPNEIAKDALKEAGK